MFTILKLRSEKGRPNNGIVIEILISSTTDGIEFLLSKLKQTKTNSEFFDSMNT